MVLQGIVSLSYLLYGLYLWCVPKRVSMEMNEIEAESESETEIEMQTITNDIIAPPPYDYHYKLNPLPTYLDRADTPVPPLRRRTDVEERDCAKLD